MYEERFGLKTNPFRLNAEGSAVFTGPQQATIISSLHKALAGTDNVVVVSGPAGVGKTAIVNRALETNKAHQMAATIGRMRLGPDEILELYKRAGAILFRGFRLTKKNFRTRVDATAFG